MAETVCQVTHSDKTFLRPQHACDTIMASRKHLQWYSRVQIQGASADRTDL